MHVTDMMVMVMEVMDVVIGWNCNACDRLYGNGDGHCYRMDAVLHLIDVKAMLMEIMDIVIESKLL